MGTITARPGKRLKVRVLSYGKLQKMTHNFVLLKLGSDPKKFSDAAARSPFISPRA